MKHPLAMNQGWSLYYVGVELPKNVLQYNETGYVSTYDPDQYCKKKLNIKPKRSRAFYVLVGLMRNLFVQTNTLVHHAKAGKIPQASTYLDNIVSQIKVFSMK